MYEVLFRGVRYGEKVTITKHDGSYYMEKEFTRAPVRVSPAFANSVLRDERVPRQRHATMAQAGLPSLGKRR
jgi:hypothetical protein